MINRNEHESCSNNISTNSIDQHNKTIGIGVHLPVRFWQFRRPQFLLEILPVLSRSSVFICKMNYMLNNFARKYFKIYFFKNTFRLVRVVLFSTLPSVNAIGPSTFQVADKKTHSEILISNCNKQSEITS